jgi:hypothetical protein
MHTTGVGKYPGNAPDAQPDEIDGHRIAQPTCGGPALRGRRGRRGLWCAQIHRESGRERLNQPVEPYTVPTRPRNGPTSRSEESRRTLSLLVAGARYCVGSP